MADRKYRIVTHISVHTMKISDGKEHPPCQKKSVVIHFYGEYRRNSHKFALINVCKHSHSDTHHRNYIDESFSNLYTVFRSRRNGRSTALPDKQSVNSFGHKSNFLCQTRRTPKHDTVCSQHGNETVFLAPNCLRTQNKHCLSNNKSQCYISTQ